MNGEPRFDYDLFLSHNRADKPRVRRLAERGLLLWEGTIVNTTLIAAPPSTKNRSKERDPQMHQTEKRQSVVLRDEGAHWGRCGHGGAYGGGDGGERGGRDADGKTRYRDLAKNTAQLFSLFGLANLVLAKRWLWLPEGGSAP